MRKLRTSAHWGLCFVFMATLSLACEPGESSKESLTSGPGEVRYFLDWTPASKALVQADGTLKMTNNLGFDVVLEEAYLVTSRAEVVTCATNETQSSGIVSTVKGWAMALFGVSEAHAGHSAMPDNDAAIDHSWVENLLHMEEELLGARSLDDAPYCQAHYLSARASNGSEGLPEDFDMTDRSLYVRGYALDPGTGETLEFEGSTDLSNGVLSTLSFDDAQTFVHEGLDGNLDVVIVRDMTHLFDEVDFTSTSSQTLGWRALDNMMLHLEIVGAPTH